MVSIPQRLLGEALLFSARKAPSKTAIIVKNEEYSYQELKEKAETLAHYLVNSGIKKEIGSLFIWIIPGKVLYPYMVLL